MSRTRWRLAGALAALGLVGCSLSTAPEGPFANLRGTWAFTGSQAVPALELSGTLSITGQDADQIVGSLSWIELDATGGTTARAGQVSGSVIGVSDVDFSVTSDASERRYVAEVRADTLSGVWVSLGSSQSGSFRAVRTP